MKKLLCLFLCALLCMSAAFPVVAEEERFTISTPILASDYEAWFQACAAALGGEEMQVTWTIPENSENLRVCLFDGMSPGIGYITDGETVDALVFSCAGGFDEGTVQQIQALFLYLACPLLTHDGSDLMSAVVQVQSGLVSPFFDGTMLNAMVDFGGLTAVASGQASEDGSYVFQFLLNMKAETPDAEDAQ